MGFCPVPVHVPLFSEAIEPCYNMRANAEVKATTFMQSFPSYVINNEQGPASSRLRCRGSSRGA